MRHALHELLVGAVTSNGGEVVDNTGDGVMAAFDSASSAVEAGVAMHRAAAIRNRRVPDAEAIRLRVGVHTGEVMADDNDRWFGMPVVIAARLCNAARTDEVLTSSVVAALIEGQIGYELEARGELELKGVGTPVRATSVAWETECVEVTLPTAVAAARRGMFTGRDDLLHALDRTWSTVAHGARVTAFLIGEPGIGKSRLASEFAYRAGLAGALVLAGGCDAHLAVPFRPFVSALTYLVANVGRDRALEAIGHPPSDALVKLVPELGPSGTGDDSIDPETERLQLFTEIDACARSVVCTMGGAHGERFAAGVALHPSFCTTDGPDSPHLLVPSIAGSMYVAFGSRHEAVAGGQRAVHRRSQRHARRAGRGGGSRRRRPRLRRPQQPGVLPVRSESGV